MKKSVTDIDIKGKKVILRCDFNVPLDENKNITDNSRIVSSLKTIKYLINNDAKIILCSHLGRPKGEVNLEYSLMPVKNELEKLLGLNIKFGEDIDGEKTREIINSLKDREIILLENLRFRKEEEENNEEFAKSLASLADIYVNDAFGTSHRKHASVYGITKYIPSVAGFLMEKEIKYLKNALDKPEKPYIAILGGKKVSDKIKVIENLTKKVDSILIGGAMAFTFLHTLGYSVGSSIVEDEKQLVIDIFKNAKLNNVKILLPLDIVVAKNMEGEDKKIVNSNAIPEGYMGLDIGPKTISIFLNEIEKAKTVFWNGPMGAFENELFEDGTKIIAKGLADLNALTIVGGGDSAAAVKKYNLEEKFSHISTGGGASLELIEGKELPGIVSLMNKE